MNVAALFVATIASNGQWPLRVDGRTFTVRLDPQAEHPLTLTERGRVLDYFLKKEWKPWKLQIADGDGDGRPDIAVGIVKRTRHLPQPHTCLWIIGVRDGHFTRKWLGSTMGRPLEDFCFVDGKHLFTLQKTLDGKHALNRYEWARFGFRKIGADKVFNEASGLHQQNGKIVLNGDGKQWSFFPKEWK